MSVQRLVSVPAVLVALCLSAAAIAEEASSGLAIGSSAPKADVAMKSVDGKGVSIRGAAGPKGTLVVFTCNHCPWAKAWESRIVEIGNAAAAKGIGVVAINSNDPAAYAEDSFEEMQKRARERGMRFPYVVDADSGVARAFGATRTPEVFLFDAGGQLVYKGAVDDNAKEAAAVKERFLADAVDAVAKGAAPKVSETKALGCSIKFRSAS
jgi:hypothetical protein